MPLNLTVVLVLVGIYIGFMFGLWYYHRWIEFEKEQWRKLFAADPDAITEVGEMVFLVGSTKPAAPPEEEREPDFDKIWLGVKSSLLTGKYIEMTHSPHEFVNLQTRSN